MSSVLPTPPGRPRMAMLALLLGPPGGLWPAVAAAQKTDGVVMINGDVITGEVKGLSRGKLDYNTDDIGRLSIEWGKVIGVTSRHHFELKRASGKKYYGRLSSPQNDGTVIVADERGDTLRIWDVFEINPIAAGFFQRTKAYLDAGFTLCQGEYGYDVQSVGAAGLPGSQGGRSVVVRNLEGPRCVTVQDIVPGKDSEKNTGA